MSSSSPSSSLASTVVGALFGDLRAITTIVGGVGRHALEPIAAGVPAGAATRPQMAQRQHAGLGDAVDHSIYA